MSTAPPVRWTSNSDMSCLPQLDLESVRFPTSAEPSLSPSRTVFTLLFELSSSYGNIGLSIGNGIVSLLYP